MTSLLLYKKFTTNMNDAHTLNNVESYEHKDGCLHIRTNCYGTRRAYIIPDSAYAIAELSGDDIL